MRIPISWSRIPTLEKTFSTRANSVGFLRLVLATSVLIAHSWPLGLGKPSLFWPQTHGQADLGALGVNGFFVLSGFLISSSALRFSLPRFAWHRVLRIFPGFWVCLLVTAFVIAPAVAWYERGTLHGFWTHPYGPVQYMLSNWLTGIRQFGIADLLSTTPFGHLVHGPSAFGGSLWSLVFELCCYVAISALAVTAVLRRAPRAILLLLVITYAVIVDDFFSQPGYAALPLDRGLTGTIPFIGPLSNSLLCYLGFAFLLGVSAQLYKHRLPMHPAAAAVAAVALVISMLFGGFFVIGLPCFAYLLLWAACALPRQLQGIGRSRDYSYGVYIYGFPVQQVVALVGGARYGVVVFIALSALGTAVFAAASWHLVERPAMSLKDWTPGRRRSEADPGSEPVQLPQLRTTDFRQGTPGVSPAVHADSSAG